MSDKGVSNPGLTGVGRVLAIIVVAIVAIANLPHLLGEILGRIVTGLFSAVKDGVAHLFRGSNGGTNERKAMRLNGQDPELAEGEDE